MPSSNFQLDTDQLRNFAQRMRSDVVEGHLTDTKSRILQLVDELTATLDETSRTAMNDSITAVHTSLQSLSDSLEKFSSDCTRVADDTDQFRKGTADSFRSIHTQ